MSIDLVELVGFNCKPVDKIKLARASGWRPHDRLRGSHGKRDAVAKSIYPVECIDNAPLAHDA